MEHHDSEYSTDTDHNGDDEASSSSEVEPNRGKEPEPAKTVGPVPAVTTKPAPAVTSKPKPVVTPKPVAAPKQPFRPAKSKRRKKKRRADAHRMSMRDFDAGTGRGCFRTAGDIRYKGYYRSHDIKTPWFIKFLAHSSVLWEIFMYISIVANTGLTMYGIFFTYHNKFVWNVVTSLDLLFGVDVIIRLSVELWRYKSQSEVIIFPIPYRFLYCMVDVLSLIPVQTLYIVAFMDQDSFSHIRTMDYYRTTTLLRCVPRFFLFYEFMRDSRIVSDQLLFIIKFFNLYLAFINVVSCVLFMLLNLNPVDQLLWNLDAEKLKRTWAREIDSIKPGYGHDPLDLFILTTHFSTATTTTVGYGDLYAITEVEMIFCICVMLVGAIFLNGFFTSEITNFQLEVDGARFDLYHRLRAIKYFLNQAGMNSFFASKVEQYYDCLWTYREGVENVTFIDHIPRSLQEDLYYDVCLEMFHKSNLFQGLDEAFLRAVSRVSKISLYNPDMILCRFGSYANRMYYLIQGECQAMHKHDLSKRAAVLRAGSLIGEINLFFSCPYTVSVETITCCQFISIDKEELMAVFSNFSMELDLIRARSEIKLMEMYDYYQAFGIDPICWVEKRIADEDPNDAEEDPVPKAVGRWGDGFNEVVYEDIIIEADRFVIFETPCIDKKFEKNHVTPYMTCVVPEILTTKVWWISYWNFMIIASTLIHSFIGPYCLAFGQFGFTSSTEKVMCSANEYVLETLITLVYIVDVMMEILGACPVQGMYFKLWDGLKIRKRQFMFYVDIISSIPLRLFTRSHSLQIRMYDSIFKSLKFWKAIRYLGFMENVYPRRLFMFRISQTLLVLLYGIHYIACMMFYLACFDDTSTEAGRLSCTTTRFNGHDHPKISWLGSHKNTKDISHIEASPEEDPDYISKNMPYAISIYFSAATLTSAGFGDFNPQNKKEITITIFFQLIGFFIIGYYTALLTSALACVVKPKLEFTQKLVSIRRFMDYYSMPETLHRRVVEHYELQHQLHNGVNLRPGVKHYLYDTPDYLKNDALYTDIVVLLDGIPLFSKIESKFIIKLAECLKRYLIPPNVEFLQAGEVRRTLYILRSGSMGVFNPGSEEGDDPTFLLEESAHFGLRDLLFQEPSQYMYKTLSFCLLFEIKYKDFQEIFEADDEELMEHIEACKEKIRTQPHHNIASKYKINPEFKTSDTSNAGDVERRQTTDRSVDIPSWIWFKPKAQDKMAVIRYDEYIDYFNRVGGGRFWRFFLMNGVVHPNGVFIKVWSSLVSIVAMISVMFLVMETYMHCRTPGFRITQAVLDSVFYLDLYIKMHKGYYLKDGLLIAHPLKTATNYIINGNFLIDVILCAHPEAILILWGYTGPAGAGPGATWYSKIRWSKIGQIFRIPRVFQIVHGVFKQRTISLFILYVTVTLIVCTAVGAIALFLACPWGNGDWAGGDEYKLPLCQQGSWADTDNIGDSIEKRAVVLSIFFKRWIIAVYYVCQVILVIGFGDMITLNIMEIYLLIFMSVFGFVFLRCIIADITAAEVDSDEIRARYIIRMNRVLTAMQRENCDKKLINSVQEHLAHTWKQSRGLQPRDLFYDLHATLESDLYHCFVGDELKKVPVFKEFENNALQGIRKHVKKLHFLPGERISRAGNLEYEMHIIVRGKVWVAHESLIYGCCLHKHESFGEASLISHGPRKYNFIAGTSVETFVITQEEFSLIFERYPGVRKLLVEYTGNGTYDFFQHKIYDEVQRLHNMSPEDKNKAININWKKTSQLRHILSTREPEPDGDEEEEEVKPTKWRATIKAKFYRHVISRGIDDDNLPFLYFVPQKKKTREGRERAVYLPPIIHSNCGLAKLFLQFMNGVFYLYPAVTLYELCFPIFEHDLFDTSDAAGIGRYIEILSNVLTYIYLFYILAKFFFPYQDQDGFWIKSSKAIATNYLMSMSGFLLDFLVICPSLIFTFMSYDQKMHTLTTHNVLDITRPKWRDIKLTSLLLLYRFLKHQWAKSEDLRISAFEQKIIVSVSSFAFMSHALACWFYRISACVPPPNNDDDERWSKMDKFCKTETWPLTFLTGKGWLEVKAAYTPWKWYIRAFYWVTAVVSTTGFGDITPQNVTEMVCGIICVFCGGFILSVILSQFTSGMASLTKGYREYMYQVKLLVRYLRNVGLSSLRQDQIRLYFHCIWKNCRGKLYHSSLEILPTAMRIEVANALFESILKEVLFFSPKQIPNKSFIRQVAARVTHAVYLPGICIVKEGDPGDNLYIVYRGRVSGVLEGDDCVILKSVYVVGDVFGKVPALFYDGLYRKHYRAEEYTEVLALSQKDILHLASIYVDFWKLLTAYVELHYNPNGDYDCIFSEARSQKAKDIFDLGDDYSAAENKAKKDKDKLKTKKPKKDVLAHAQVNKKDRNAAGIKYKERMQKKQSISVIGDHNLHTAHQESQHLPTVTSVNEIKGPNSGEPPKKKSQVAVNEASNDVLQTPKLQKPITDITQSDAHKSKNQSHSPKAKNQSDAKKSKKQSHSPKAKNQSDAKKSKNQSDAKKSKNQSDATKTNNQSEAPNAKNQKKALEPKSQKEVLESKNQSEAMKSKNKSDASKGNKKSAAGKSKNQNDAINTKKSDDHKAKNLSDGSKSKKTDAPKVDVKGASTTAKSGPPQLLKETPLKSPPIESVQNKKPEKALPLNPPPVIRRPKKVSIKSLSAKPRVSFMKIRGKPTTVSPPGASFHAKSDKNNSQFQSQGKSEPGKNVNTNTGNLSIGRKKSLTLGTKNASKTRIGKLGTSPSRDTILDLYTRIEEEPIPEPPPPPPKKKKRPMVRRLTLDHNDRPAWRH